MEDYLQHHGVKGMKWGVRKDRGSESERKQKKQSIKNISSCSQIEKSYKIIRKERLAMIQKDEKELL